MGKRKLREKLGKALDCSVKCDLWGQVVEAIEGYEKLVQKIVNTVPTLCLENQDQYILHGLVCILKSRCNVLTNEDVTDFPGLEDMKKISRVLDNLFVEHEIEECFPFQVEKLELYKESFWASQEQIQLAQPTKPGGLLVPRPASNEGANYLSIEIKNIGIKGAEEFEKPYVRVSVISKKGALLGPKQETPVAEKQIRYRVDFNTLVHVQTSVQEIVENNAAIFLEFVHYKSKKKKHSTKCWSLLEPDEFTAGEKLLEI